MKKLNIDFIRNKFEEEGYKLLTFDYSKNNQKLWFVCPNKHEYFITWMSWQKGHRCKKCFFERLGNILRNDFSEIKNSMEKEGFKILSSCKDYKISSKSKIKFSCSKGHTHSVTWEAWKGGARCKYCLLESRRLDYNFVKSEFEKGGYKLLTKIYINNNQKLVFICSNGHKHYISYAKWSQGKRCGICAGNNRLSLNKIKSSFEKENYKLLSNNNYVDSKKKLLVTCPENHSYEVKWNDFQQGRRCPICFNSKSRAENSLYEFLTQFLAEDLFQRNKNIISPQELDIFIPSKNIAIEYCGLYWHSELMGKDKNYHLNKLNMCNEKGIRLITIFEDEWIYRREIVEKCLLSILGIAKVQKINARDSYIKEISFSEARLFCDEYHLQGYSISSVQLGLFFEGQLLSVMTFSKPSISKGSKNENDNMYEISRFCTDYNYSIRGGFSKLLSFFKENFDPKMIYSYVDRRWFDGISYRKIGFQHIGDTKPNYWYFKYDKRYHRFNFRKDRIIKIWSDVNQTKTEKEIMKEKGYGIIWDCGNYKFEWLS